MPLSDIIAGPFTAQFAPKPASGSYSFASLGTLTNDGFDEIEMQNGTPLTSNLYGETILDGITAGSEGMLLNFVLQQANLASVRNLVKSYYLDTDLGVQGNFSGTNALEGAVSPAGMLWSNIAGRLLLTPVVGTSADYGNSNDHIRYYRYCVLANGSEIRKKFWYRERYIPISLRVLPYLDSGNVFRFWQYIDAASSATSP